jgi:hypothetical protein
MTDSMPPRISDPDVARELGEIRAELRELIHSRNNSEMRDEAVARSLAKLEEIPKRNEIMDRKIDDKLEKKEQRLSTLEEDKV